MPAALKQGPFTIAEARELGVTRSRLRGADYRPLGAGLYRWAGLELSPELLLAAVWRRLPMEAAFCGWTAAWLHGLDCAPCNPIEVNMPEPTGSSRRSGAAVRRYEMQPDEIVSRRGMPCTAALRTVVDLGGRIALTDGVIAADLFLHRRLVSLEELHAYVRGHAGKKGVARLRRVLRYVEPKSESAMETRLRMLLELGGLPRPESQVPIHDDQGRFLGRPDLLYRQQRLAIEYDGANHRERLTSDDQRQNGLVGAGYRLLRFTAPDVLATPESVVTQVRQVLGRAA